jgi:hypothetical protein
MPVCGPKTPFLRSVWALLRLKNKEFLKKNHFGHQHMPDSWAYSNEEPDIRAAEIVQCVQENKYPMQIEGAFMRANRHICTGLNHVSVRQDP